MSELQTETNSLNGTNTFQSTLSLTNPQPARDSGEYYCQATVDGVDLLPSKSFRLSDDENVYAIYVECFNAYTYYSTATKCADLAASESTPLPATNPTIHTKTDSSTLPPSTHGQGMATNQYVTLETTGMSQTTSANANTLVDSSETVPEPFQIWIYLLACVVGVFGVIIVILGASICIHIVRKKTQSR